MVLRIFLIFLTTNDENQAFLRSRLSLDAVKDAVISTVETQFPDHVVTSVQARYASPTGYYEDRYPSQRELSGFKITMELKD